MPINTVDLDVAFYRASSLRYSRKAHSPKGSRDKAGRFNEDGTSALYLALEPETALAEYWQGDPPTPVVLIPGELSIKRVIDLTGGAGAFGDPWQNWQCDWRQMRDLRLGDPALPKPYSWECGAEAIKRNCNGILFPSIANPGGRNLVFYNEDAIAGTFSIAFSDPSSEFGDMFPPDLT